jgi:hypothetical protein
MKKIGYDQAKIDQLRIVDDKKKCCLRVNAVITKVGVYPYPDGRAFKSRMELLKATRTAKNAKITILDHPDSMVIMSQNQIYGTVENPFFERDKIRATLNFDKYVTPPRFLADVRAGKLKDVSIGFYYAPDATPGNWNGQPYDYVMRDIVIDHVAAGVVKGRCTFPSCGIGVDAMMRQARARRFVIDKVVKRGEKWCVVHCHPDGSVGETIKCFPTKPEAEAMHRAIQAQKGASQKHVSNMKTIDQDEKPPKEWMDQCKAVVKQGQPDYTEEQVNAVCADIWHHKPEQKGIGDAFTVLTGLIKKRRKKTVAQPLEEEEVLEDLSEQEVRYPTRSEAFKECVRVRIAEGMTRGEAEAHCEAATLPSDEPAPPPGETGTAQEEKTPFEQCVANKMAEGMSREDAEEACKGEAAGDQEVEKTPLERCIAEQVDAGKSAEEAREWCEAELAGEHEQATDLIERSEKLLKMKEQRDIERQRESRRHPV